MKTRDAISGGDSVTHDVAAAIGPFRSSAADVARALQRLEYEMVACSLVGPPACDALIDAVADLPYRVAKREAGPRAVRQDFEICMGVPERHVLRRLAARIGSLIDEALALMDPAPLTWPCVLNDIVVQRYAAGSFGITPHRDHVRYRDIVVLLMLCGDGDFYTCRDRAGTETRIIDARPGDVLLMRAPGFAGSAARPFHGLADVRSLRYSVGFRHDTLA